MDVKVPDDDAGWMIDDEAQAGSAELAPGASPAPWRVLIVDDDVDVHVVTKFSLSNACFMGRRLSFLHAYSGEEALTTLRNNQPTTLPASANLPCPESAVTMRANILPHVSGVRKPLRAAKNDRSLGEE